MSILSSLLRILLCLTLALSGWTQAFAAASMHPAAGLPSAGPEEGRLPPCHGESHSQAQDDDAEHPASDHGADCCAGACDCPCAQVSVALTLALFPPAADSHGVYEAAAQPAVGTRALPNLIRPPIG